MDQRSQQQSSDSRDQKLAELERRLTQANQVIANLQQQNLALKKQFQNQESEQEIIQNSQLSVGVSPTKQKKSRTNYLEPRIITNQKKIPKQKNKLQHLHFYGLVTLVVILIVGIFTVSHLMTYKKSSKSSKINNIFAQTRSIKISPPPPQVSPNSGLKVTNTPVEISAHPPLFSQPIAVLPTINSDFIYNLVEPPLQKNSKLQVIVDDLVQLVKSYNLSTENLSITLIDLNQNTIAGYQQETPRFPASVAKLFWLVILQAKIQSGSIVPDSAINSEIDQMITQSDNDATSKIIDRITNAPTREKLAKIEYQDWKAKRDSLNTFFTKAGYKNININQKTFPIPHHYSKNISEPQGSDLQIRGDNPKKPIRNKLTSFAASRLMYEIASEQAVSPESSKVMKTLLARDLQLWQKQPLNPEEFHPVKNFLGEYLPANKVRFISKAGWTTNSRGEVAYIETHDGKAKYVIAVFGDDSGYAKSRDIFPKLSYAVFQKMTKQ
ncbi:serine hydrolase [Calothrix sp. UHCC 0171]|uniref:serine hydrolase n=1 Tax=Calothrix sp. UHCC 0171 TaxID=3110245 RepID=UPI002B1F4993|nr:serine hydrolase [Calothrix sp. UHCC 0171]MEA5571191.1 serine hydrolase [Calothrix sp. UHCC 0171]